MPRVKEHPCIGKIDELLATRGGRLKLAIKIDGSPRDVYVATEPLEGKRKDKVGLLAATYCPFCGKKMPR